MSEAVATPIIAAAEQQPAPEPVKLSLHRSDVLWPLTFLLGLAMIGLKFPLGFMVVFISMLNRWQQSREEFLLQLMLLLGGYGMVTSEQLHFNTVNLAFYLGIAGMFLLRKPPLLRKAILLWIAYAIVLLTFAYLSEETLKNQQIQLTRYALFIFFTVPLMVFSGRHFDMDKFLRLVIIYTLIMSIFYILDCVIFCGNLLVPRTWLGSDADSTFWRPLINPMSMSFTRKYPPGLFIMGIAIVPIIKQYKLRPWMWTVLVSAMFCTFTFSFITGVVLMYMLFKSTPRNILLYGAIGLAGLVALYFIDDAIGYQSENGESALRIKSSVDQIIHFDQAEDEEDLARFGSGRMAQIIPKVALLYDMDRQWIGFGFLDRNVTKMQKYIIENEFYLNPDEAEEVATGVEMMPVQVFLTMGFIGLFFHILFFVLIYLLIRRLRYSDVFLCAMLCYVWWGLAGFEGLITNKSMIMLATVYGAVILANKEQLEGFALPRKKHAKS